MINLQKRADNYRNNGETKKAIELYQNLYEFHSKNKKYAEAGNALQMFGVCHKIDNDLKNSLLWLRRALRFYQKHNLKTEEGNTLRDIGISYQYRGIMDKARANLEQSIGILETTADKASLGVSIAKLGNIYKDLKDFDLAEMEFRRAIEVLETTNHWFFIATAYWNWAELKNENKEYQNSISLLSRAKDIFSDHQADAQNLRRFSQINGLLANNYANINETETAKQFLNLSLGFLDSKKISGEARKVLAGNIKLRETISLLRNHEKRK